MVDNYHRSRRPLRTTPSSNIFLTFCILLIMLFACSNCHQHGSNQTDVMIITENIPHSQWDNIFTDHLVIPFNFPDSDREIFSIGGMRIASSGDYFIFDGKAKKVLNFNAEGKFEQYIGSQGEGPGEYGLAGCSYIDEYDNLFIYDIVKRRINKYKYPNYQFEKQFLLPISIQDFLLDNRSNFIVYTVSDPNLIFKIDIKGNTLKKVRQVDQHNFRIFSSRFQLGRICKIPGDFFLVSYPEEYKIYIYDYQLNLKKTLYTDSTSKYFPKKVLFPANLSPYNYSPKHSKWWGEALKPSMVLYIGKQMFAMLLIEFNNLSYKFYVNIHDLKGNTYAAGLEIPFEGIIRYAKDGFIYVVEESKFDENKQITPIKLHRYKLKEIL